MPLHASPSPQIQPIPPRIPSGAEPTDGRKAARFWDFMNVADRPLLPVDFGNSARLSRPPLSDSRLAAGGHGRSARPLFRSSWILSPASAGGWCARGPRTDGLAPRDMRHLPSSRESADGTDSGPEGTY